MSQAAWTQGDVRAAVGRRGVTVNWLGSVGITSASGWAQPALQNITE
jgi:hypothetical protein